MIRSTLGRSGTFGAIFLRENENDRMTLQHEFGHAVQMQILGIINYSIAVFPASAGRLGVNKNNYYKKPWELSASLIGGYHVDEYNFVDYVISALYLLTASVDPLLSYLFFLYGW